MPASIISEFMCPCGDNCGKALAVCECGDAAGYVKEIESMQVAGMSAQAIRDKFVARYGPSVLSTPPAHGFGMLAYVAPPASVLLGVVVVIILIRSWRRPARGGSVPAVSAADVKKAEEMLKKWK